MLTRPTAKSGTQTLTWDPEGHLASSRDSTGTTTYVYDADGNRLVRSDPAGKTLYLPGQEVRYTAGTGVKTCTRYYSHVGGVVATRTGKGVTWLSGDHHGTAQISVDAKTQATAIRRQTPFGGERATTGTWPKDITRGFVGGVNDNTGLTHLGAREYDTQTGRFISVDPILTPDDPQQLNGYAYANNSPTTSSDPSGLLGSASCEKGFVGGPGACTGHEHDFDKPEPELVAVREEKMYEKNMLGNPVPKKSRMHTYWNHNGKLVDNQSCTRDIAAYAMSGPVACTGGGSRTVGTITGCREGNNPGSVCYLGEDGYTHDIDGGRSCAKSNIAAPGACRPPKAAPITQTNRSTGVDAHIKGGTISEWDKFKNRLMNQGGPEPIMEGFLKLEYCVVYCQSFTLDSHNLYFSHGLSMGWGGTFSAGATTMRTSDQGDFSWGACAAAVAGGCILGGDGGNGGWGGAAASVGFGTNWIIPWNSLPAGYGLGKTHAVFDKDFG
jgi:RHS repeat-associated protein